MGCGSGCGCGSGHEDPKTAEIEKSIPSPEPPPIAPRIAQMSEDDRESLKQKLQKMSVDEIKNLTDDEFRDLVTWIMEYTSWLYSTAEHKVIMAVVANDYKQWFDIFLERYGIPRS
ncbi:MAG: hypothetical protein HYW25_04405 [Candidatus Aenigmarchaeota archaeon]|nr:hypothetical protein [Candidatus Aenigmarchaeota archaeon]